MDRTFICFFLKEQEGQGTPTRKFIKQRTELQDYSKGKTGRSWEILAEAKELERERKRGTEKRLEASNST